MTDRFLDKSWIATTNPSLNNFFKSSYYKRISLLLKQDIQKGYKIAPVPENIFRAFKECIYRNINTVIITTEPYHGMLPNGNYQADGLAFSCKHSKLCPMALEKIYENIDRTVYNNEGEHLTDSYDLAKWASQGVLLLNYSLTTIVGRPQQHIIVWEEFTKYVIRFLNLYKSDLFFVLIGPTAQSLRTLITNHKVIMLEDVYLAINEKNRTWKSFDVFNQINEFHAKNNIKINW